MRSKTLALSLSIAVGAFVAACGGSTPTPEVPSAPAPSASLAAPPTSATTPPAPTATTPPAAATATASASAVPPPAAGPKLPDVKPSTFGDALKEIGLDIGNLPKMSKLTAAQRSKVMPLLQKATGFACKECHDGDKDFKKKTPHKEVAERMWDEYVVPNKFANGAVFCDSCHTGTHGFLPRKDQETVKAFMDEITKKISKKDGKALECSTCHTDTFESNIFEKVWKIKGAPHARTMPIERFVVGLVGR